MASSTQSIDGVLIVSPLKMPSMSLPPFVMRKILGSGRGGVKLSRRSTARGESAIMPWAASPPSTFCHDQVTTSSFAQSSSIAKTAEVASQIASPARWLRDPLGVGDPNSRGRAVPGEDDVVLEVHAFVRSGSSP